MLQVSACSGGLVIVVHSRQFRKTFSEADLAISGANGLQVYCRVRVIRQQSETCSS